MPVAKFWDGTAWVSLPAARESIVALDSWHIVGSAGEPAFLNSWANRDVATYGSLSFRKDPFGRVRLRGVIISGTSGTAIFTLPVGYRPPKIVYIPVLGVAGAAGNYLSVAPDGTVQGTRSGSDLYIENVEFDTDSVASFVTASLPGPELVTVLPAYPLDGKEVYLRIPAPTPPTNAHAGFAAQNADAVVWHLRYNTAITDAYKWEFVGGAPLKAQGYGYQTSVGVANSWEDGQSPLALAAPRAGVYDLEAGCGQVTANGTNHSASLAVAVAGATPSDPIAQVANTAGSTTAGIRIEHRATVASGADVRFKQHSTVVGSVFRNRYLQMRPVRLS